MNIHAVNLLFDAVKVVNALTIASPSTSTPAYVSMKGFRKCAVLLSIKPASGANSAMAITMHQATAIAGTNVKALAFTKMYSNVDTGAADAMAAVAVTSNTFTTSSGTANKLYHYLIDIDVEQLDRANGFDCLRVGVADPTNATLAFCATYFLYGARYASSPPPTAVVD